MDNQDVTVIVLSIIFIVMFVVIVALMVFEIMKGSERDNYITFTLFFLAAGFLFRAIILVYILQNKKQFRDSEPPWQCHNIITNVLPYTCFVIAAAINLIRWIGVTKLCYIVVWDSSMPEKVGKAGKFF